MVKGASVIPWSFSWWFDKFLSALYQLTCDINICWMAERLEKIWPEMIMVGWYHQIELPLQLTSLFIQRWMDMKHFIIYNRGGIEREWIFQKNEESLTLKFDLAFQKNLWSSEKVKIEKNVGVRKERDLFQPLAPPKCQMPNANASSLPVPFYDPCFAGVTLFSKGIGPKFWLAGWLLLLLLLLLGTA